MANEQLRRNRQNGRAHHPLCGCRNTQRVCRHVAHISQRLVARCGLHHLLDIHHLRKIPDPPSRRAQRSQRLLPLSLPDEYENRVRGERHQREPLQHDPFRVVGLQPRPHLQKQGRHEPLYENDGVIPVAVAVHRQPRVLGKGPRHRQRRGCHQLAVLRRIHGRRQQI
jgi:hypothetical protein